MQFINKSVLKSIYKKRHKECHKGDFGNLLIIGGSEIYSGSPALVALSAIKTGVDLTCIVAPERCANICASFSPDIITYPLKGKYFQTEHLKNIEKIIDKYDAITIGNGMCRNEHTKKAVIEFLKTIEKPCVIDADAIHFISTKRDIIKSNFIITPHSLEFQKLSGINVIGKKLDYKIKIVEKTAKNTGCTILLKGNIDIISNGNKTMLNRTGSVFMTKGGTGDTLVGILGAFLSRGVKPFHSACASAFLNGLAGEFASKRYGEGLMASDLINEIPNVLKSI